VHRRLEVDIIEARLDGGLASAEAEVAQSPGRKVELTPDESMEPAGIEPGISDEGIETLPPSPVRRMYSRSRQCPKPLEPRRVLPCHLSRD
jgi:hypothetical protein